MHSQEQNRNNRQAIVEKNKRASTPILADLSEIGLDVEWVDDLYSKRLDYQRAIPVLIKWLPLIENPDVKESIVRALTVRWAKGTEAQQLLVNEFQKSKGYLGLNWAIGNALSIVADDKVLDEIIGFINDETYGKGREMLVIALGNMKSPEVYSLLINLLDDDELAGFAIMALGKLRFADARPHIEKFLIHPKSWVRKEAKKAIKRIDSSSLKV